MRTNVNIAKESRDFATHYAYANGLTLGEAITALIERGRENLSRVPFKKEEESNDAVYPIFRTRGSRLTTEIVREAECDEYD